MGLKIWHIGTFLVGKHILEEAPEAVEDALGGVFDGDGQRWLLLQLWRWEDDGREGGELGGGGSGGGGDGPPPLVVDAPPVNLLRGGVWVHRDGGWAEKTLEAFDQGLHHLVKGGFLQMLPAHCLYWGLVPPPLPDPLPVQDVSREGGAEHDVG